MCFVFFLLVTIVDLFKSLHFVVVYCDNLHVFFEANIEHNQLQSINFIYAPMCLIVFAYYVICPLIGCFFFSFCVKSLTSHTIT